MQTFLPYPDFDRSVACLDYRRLGKQRVEAFQILRTLDGVSSGWIRHPAVRMWKGYEQPLRQYLRSAILRWMHLGYRNNMEIPDSEQLIVMPPFVGNDLFHASHRSNLLRKNKDWYSRFGWTEPDDLPYVWPV